jgi:ATP-binding cassette subfamily B protein
LSLFNAFNANRRYLIPEVIQTSAMDCGPATLKAVLEGYYIPASYERLRDVCQTDVSGTSINTIEDIACYLGLDAEQVIIQNDHLLLPETDALPAIVVVRLPDGTGHFVVVWRIHGQMIQIMDPAIGRIWITQQKLFDMVYPFTQPIKIDIWEHYSKSDTFCLPLIRRISDLNISTSEINRLIDHAQNNDWQHMAILDASVRILHTIYHSGANFKGDDLEKILTTYYELALNEPSQQIIPKEYFSVLPDSHDSQTLFMKGALLVHIAGKTDRNSEADDETDRKEGDDTCSKKSISDILNAVIHDPPIQPEKEIYEQLLSEHQLWPFMLIFALTLAAINVAIEALLLMGFVDIGFDFSKGIYQQPMTMVSIMIFFVALLSLETPVNAAILNLGRRFEISMRMRFLTKTPVLGDHFFRSRLKSDMAQRVHDMRLIREMPEIAGGIYRLIFQMLITVVGIMYLMPTLSIIPIIAGITAVIIPMASIHLLKEQDLRFRTLTGSLAQYCLDALIGIVPLRSHSAENAIRYKFESILCQWKKSGISYYFKKLAITSTGALINTLLAICLIYENISIGGSDNCVLLLIYWVLNLSESGAQLSNLTGMYPGLRNRIFRILEPINTQPETELSDEYVSEEKIDRHTGMKIEIKHTSVFAAERQILDDIHLTIQPGEHIAIVGSSGAGKSSLMRLLLGFYHPDTGHVLIDNHLLSSHMISIRRQTAWIDPSVHIWNRPLSENIRYGTEEINESKYGMIMTQAGLIKVLKNLPDGNNTRLGEGGRLVSGGEGQRVRLGRGMYRKDARLVILDEPFRGLDRTERSQLLQKARDHWHDSTLFFISHDVQDTIPFDRVWVMSHGKIVEDGAPQALLGNKESIYRSIVNHEKKIRQSIVNKAQWRKWWIEKGEVVE